MEAAIRDVFVKLRPFPEKPALLAYVAFSLGPLTVRGTKVVQLPGGNRRVRVVWPDMPVPMPCPGCGHHVGATHRYCHSCALRQPDHPVEKTPSGKPKRYQSVVWPARDADRAAIETQILRAYMTAAGFTAAGKNKDVA